MNHQDLIIQFFSYFGLTSDQVQIDDSGETINVVLVVDPTDSGRYIGRFATTLDSLQLLLSMMINNRAVEHQHIKLDVGGYRAERLETLQRMARRFLPLIAAKSTCFSRTMNRSPRTQKEKANPAASSWLPRVSNWLFYLIVFLAPTQLGLHFWPNSALVYGVRIDYLAPTLYFFDLLIILYLIIQKFENWTRRHRYAKHFGQGIYDLKILFPLLVSPFRIICCFSLLSFPTHDTRYSLQVTPRCHPLPARSRRDPSLARTFRRWTAVLAGRADHVCGSACRRYRLVYGSRRTTRLRNFQSPQRPRRMVCPLTTNSFQIA